MNPYVNEKLEEWKEIDKHSRYSISSVGNIKNNQTGKLLKASKNKTAGYMYIRLMSDTGKRTSFRLHRLVALHFLDNPNNYEDVNHIDEDKTNNVVSNLEWCSHLENIRHGNGISRSKESRSVKIKCSNGITYNSINECAKLLNISSGSISETLNGKRKHTKGFTFERIEKDE
ncbi:NUMOD4 domain-containing protein [Enterococcus faecalis]